MYLVIEIQRLSDTTVAITPVYSTAVWAQAESEFHRLCSIAAVSSVLKHTIVFMDDGGFTFDRKSYEHG